MRVVVNSEYKSIPSGISFDLPRFCVLTGKNGSGKSHLLEAIANGGIAKVSINGTETTKIHYIGFNGLNPQVDEQCDSNQVLANVRNWWNQINGIVNHYKSVIISGQVFSNVISDYLPLHGQNPALYSIIEQVLYRSKKDLQDLTEDDVFKHISFVDITQNSLFFSQCAMIFKAYHTRKIKNEFAEFRSEKYRVPGVKFLSPADFSRTYGPPPWESINDILARARLPYQVSTPEIEDYDLPYRLRLQNKSTGVEISVNDLSSGEKVLMALALAIYNTQEGGSKPDLLLLDEPDAPLHPEFSKLLIETLIETIVGKSGVNVIITTHSPSTVAMAPDNCVFEIDRNTKIPHLVSNPRALEILTEGIDYLRVSYEKRRQVFVESKYDVQYFQRLYNLLHRKYKYTYQAVFLEPRSGSSNCTDVINIVQKLQLSGNDLAWGIIDYDNTNSTCATILVLGDGSRYAIENFLLDPLYICLALIRLGKKGFSDFGVPDKFVYTEALSLQQIECQTMVESLIVQLGFSIEDTVDSVLENGYILKYPKSFLLHHGHEYENKLMASFPELNGIAKGQGDSALKLGVLQVIEEFPQFLSVDINLTLAKIARA
jgi:predicted ATPase